MNEINYQEKFQAGVRREVIIKGLLEGWGFEVFTNGFMTLDSTLADNRPNDKDKPDFYIQNNLQEKIYIEVSGTYFLTTNALIWIRQNKLDYIQKNIENKTYLAFVVDYSKTIKFVNISTIDSTNLERIYITGRSEAYLKIPNAYVFSQEKMQNILLAWSSRRN